MSIAASASKTRFKRLFSGVASLRSRASPRQSTATLPGLCITSLLFRFAIAYLVKQRDAVGLGPQADLACVGEGRILDLEQLFAVEGYLEAPTGKVDAQAVPNVGGDRNVNSVASLPADNVERTADAVHGLVENDIVLKRIG